MRRASLVVLVAACARGRPADAPVTVPIPVLAAERAVHDAPSVPPKSEAALPVVEVLHTDVAVDGITLSDETAWQGGRDVVVAEEDEAFRTAITLLWGRGRLYAFVVARTGDGPVPPQEIVLSFRRPGHASHVALATPEIGLRAVRDGQAMPTSDAVLTWEVGQVDMSAELTIPLETLGLPAAAGSRFEVEAKRCVGEDAPRKCAVTKALLVLVADEARGP